MSLIRYTSTAPRLNDSVQTLLNKLVQKIGGVPSNTDTEVGALTKILTLLGGTAAPGDSEATLIAKALALIGGGPCSPSGLDITLGAGEKLTCFEYFGTTSHNIPAGPLIVRGNAWLEFRWQFNSGIQSVSFPDLVTCSTGLGIFIDDSNGGIIESLSAPLFATSPNGGISFQGAFHLASVDLHSIATVNGIAINGSGVLTSLSFPALVTASGGVSNHSNAVLTTVDHGSWVPTNASTIDYSDCALDAATVNDILARCVANAGFVSGDIALNGGTNSPPTGAGVANKATLIGRGVNVNTN